MRAHLNTVRNLGRSSSLYALVFQGIGGLIQVTAFLFFHGHEYLEFSRAFLEGTILSIILVLNFENIILGGQYSVSISKYFLFFWALGISTIAAVMILGSSVANFVVFCCWGVCCRIFLAWAATQPGKPFRLFLSALLVIPACLAGNLNGVMALGLLAMPLAAPSILLVSQRTDRGVRAEIWRSAGAFFRYLPHTASGLLLGYFDRYMALNVVGGMAAELYLRTVQICSWAAFICYPIVFAFRNRALRQGEQSLRNAFSMLLVLSAGLAASIGAILMVLRLIGRAPAVSAVLLSLCFLATVFSQFYQIASILNFVREKFSSINRITLLSGSVSLAIGFLIVKNYQSAIALAAMLLAGWFTQVVLTLHSLRKK